MRDLTARIQKLEAAAIKTSAPLAVRRFVVQGPVGLSEPDAVAFLRAQDHDVRDSDLNIIRVVVGAENGSPVGLPLADLTLRPHEAASALHLQRASDL